MNKPQIPLIIPPEVEEQIRFVNSRFPTQEWSGVVFYTSEGTMENIKTFKIILKDLFPMNIGFNTETISDFDEQIMLYQIQKGYELLPYAIIHSHNTMRAYFSEPDITELKVRAHCHNLYVSIVVCNAGEIVAKAALQHYIKSDALYYKTSGKNITTNSQIPAELLVTIYDCKVIKEYSNSNNFLELNKLCNKLKLSKDLLRTTDTFDHTTPNFRSYTQIEKCKSKKDKKSSNAILFEDVDDESEMWPY